MVSQADSVLCISQISHAWWTPNYQKIILHKIEKRVDFVFQPRIHGSLYLRHVAIATAGSRRRPFEGSDVQSRRWEQISVYTERPSWVNDRIHIIEVIIQCVLNPLIQAHVHFTSEHPSKLCKLWRSNGYRMEKRTPTLLRFCVWVRFSIRYPFDHHTSQSLDGCSCWREYKSTMNIYVVFRITVLYCDWIVIGWSQIVCKKCRASQIRVTSSHL